MFVIIFYGDQKLFLFNLSCMVVNLLKLIKDRCGYGDIDRVFDLIDEIGMQ